MCKGQSIFPCFSFFLSSFPTCTHTKQQHTLYNITYTCVWVCVCVVKRMCVSVCVVKKEKIRTTYGWGFFCGVSHLKSLSLSHNVGSTSSNGNRSIEFSLVDFHPLSATARDITPHSATFLGTIARDTTPARHNSTRHRHLGIIARDITLDATARDITQ